MLYRLTAFDMLDDLESTISCSKRGFNRVGHALSVVGAHHQTINDNRNIMVFISIELWRFSQVIGLTISPDSHETFLACSFKHRGKFAFPTAYQRGKNFNSGSIRKAQELIDNLCSRLSQDRIST